MAMVSTRRLTTREGKMQQTIILALWIAKSEQGGGGTEMARCEVCGTQSDRYELWPISYVAYYEAVLCFICEQEADSIRPRRVK